MAQQSALPVCEWVTVLMSGLQWISQGNRLHALDDWAAGDGAASVALAFQRDEGVAYGGQFRDLAAEVFDPVPGPLTHLGSERDKAKNSPYPL